MQIEKRIVTIIVVFILLILVGGVVYSNIEGWRYLDAVYFTTVTLTTLGYGDFTPKTDVGKIFTIFFSLAGIAIVLYALGLIGRSIVNLDFRKKEKGIIKIRKVR